MGFDVNCGTDRSILGGIVGAHGNRVRNDGRERSGFLGERRGRVKVRLEVIKERFFKF